MPKLLLCFTTCLLKTFVGSLELQIVSRYHPSQCLALRGILFCAVTSALLRVVAGHWVVTLLRNLAFVYLFIVKLLGTLHGLQVLPRSMLEEGMLVVSC